MAAVHVPTAAVARATQRRSVAGVKGARQRALSTEGLGGRKEHMRQQAGKTRRQQTSVQTRVTQQSKKRTEKKNRLKCNTKHANMQKGRGTFGPGRRVLEWWGSGNDAKDG